MKVDIARYMRPTQVQAVFLNTLKVKAYQLLDVFGQKLGVASNQDPDGNEIVENTSKRKGNTLHVIEAKDEVCTTVIVTRAYRPQRRLATHVHMTKIAFLHKLVT